MSLDTATRWSLGFWFIFGLLPVLHHALPWAVWYHDSVLPAWVQAAGSIAAIGVAFLIGERQSRHIRRLDAQRHAERLDAVAVLYVSLARECGFWLGEYESADPDRDQMQLNFSLINIAIKAIKSLDISAITNPVLMGAILEALQILPDIEANIAQDDHKLRGDADVEKVDLMAACISMLSERLCNESQRVRANY